MLSEYYTVEDWAILRKIYGTKVLFEILLADERDSEKMLANTLGELTPAIYAMIDMDLAS